jgi:retinol dehydrogenase-12
MVLWRVRRCTSAFVKSKEGEKTQKRVWEELMAKLEKISPGISADL